MALFFKRLTNVAPITFTNAFHGQPKSNFTSFRVPFGAIVAISGGILYYYDFSLPNLVFFRSTANLGLDVASCIITRYTPISDPDSKGYFDLLIKMYPEGKMSQHFASLKPDSLKSLEIYTPNMKKHIDMIAGGTGITPMLRIIEAILKNPNDNTKVSLLYANVSPDDILLKQKLDVLAASYPNLKIFYIVDNASKNWKGGLGYISMDMAVKVLPGPSDGCGPPGTMNHISGDKAKDRSQGELSGILKELGYTEQMVYKF